MVVQADLRKFETGHINGGQFCSSQAQGFPDEGWVGHSSLHYSDVAKIQGTGSIFGWRSVWKAAFVIESNHSDRFCQHPPIAFLPTPDTVLFQSPSNASPGGGGIVDRAPSPDPPEPSDGGD